MSCYSPAPILPSEQKPKPVRPSTSCPCHLSGSLPITSPHTLCSNLASASGPLHMPLLCPGILQVSLPHFIQVSAHRSPPQTVFLLRRSSLTCYTKQPLSSRNFLPFTVLQFSPVHLSPLMYYILLSVLHWKVRSSKGAGPLTVLFTAVSSKVEYCPAHSRPSAIFVRCRNAF